MKSAMATTIRIHSTKTTSRIIKTKSNPSDAPHGAISAKPRISEKIPRRISPKTGSSKASLSPTSSNISGGTGPSRSNEKVFRTTPNITPTIASANDDRKIARKLADKTAPKYTFKAAPTNPPSTRMRIK